LSITIGDDSDGADSPRPHRRLPSFARSAVTLLDIVTTNSRPWSQAGVDAFNEPTFSLHSSLPSLALMANTVPSLGEK